MAVSLQRRFDRRLFGPKIGIVLVVDCVCNFLMDLGPEIGRALVVSVRPYLGDRSVGDFLDFTELLARGSHLVPGQRSHENNWALLIPICFRLFVFLSVEGEDRGAVGILAARQPREKREGGGVESLCRGLAERHHERETLGESQLSDRHRPRTVLGPLGGAG